VTPVRRRALLFATGAAAALAGGLVAWRAGMSPDIAPTAAEDVRGLLAVRHFNDADGRSQPLAQWHDRVLVLNFWATWCAPCVEEMPDLQRIHDKYQARGLEVVGIGIDSPSNIRDFRAKLGVRFALLAAGAGGSDLGKDLGNDKGVLPFTVVVDRNGHLRRRKIGRVSPAELEGWIEPLL
jgi:thiol-disulfide isomerase/thioredoxin